MSKSIPLARAFGLAVIGHTGRGLERWMLEREEQEARHTAVTFEAGQWHWVRSHTAHYPSRTNLNPHPGKGSRPCAYSPWNLFQTAPGPSPEVQAVPATRYLHPTENSTAIDILVSSSYRGLPFSVGVLLSEYFCMASPNPESFLVLSRLATTNNAPTSQDASFIREVVEGLDGRAKEIREQLLKLELELQDVERNQKFFKPMLSSLRRVPLEILGEIFVWLTTMNHRQQALATICKVCKRWRDAACLVPSLWDNVSVNPSKDSLSYEGVSAWLGRARGLPRTVRVDYAGCEAPVNKKGVWVGQRCSGEDKCGLSNPALGKILKGTSSLHHVFIQPPTHQCLLNLIKNLSDTPDQRSWTEINSFAIELTCDFPFPARPSILVFDNHIIPHSVTALQLEMPDHEDAQAGAEPAFHIEASVLRRLTSFNLTCDWPAKHIYKPLRHCSNLETLHLNLGGAGAVWPNALVDHPRTIPLPRLKRLVLENVQPEFVRTFQLLEMPALTELSIQFSFDGWDPSDGFNYFHGDLGTSFSTFLHGTLGTAYTLKDLQIINGEFLDNTLFDALHDLSSLKHLTLDNVVFKPDLFSKLSSRNAMLKLESLYLQRLHMKREKLSGLQAFVDKRATRATILLARDTVKVRAYDTPGFLPGQYLPRCSTRDVTRHAFESLQFGAICLNSRPSAIIFQDLLFSTQHDARCVRPVPAACPALKHHPNHLLSLVMAIAPPMFHRTLCRLATTNTPPSAQDATFIRETVDDIDQKLAEKRALILQLEEEVKDLERERNYFTPILSPIRRMPMELLGEIFGSSGKPEPHFRRVVQRGVQPAPESHAVSSSPHVPNGATWCISAYTQHGSNTEPYLFNWKA
ncbi:hypothetical protein NMY22_g4804 [Coprinellus aureogranulatus]|nr:hypothetical protein NMY22_g4804 [Coprinellus aureogranulatus]